MQPAIFRRSSRDLAQHFFGCRCHLSRSLHPTYPRFDLRDRDLPTEAVHSDLLRRAINGETTGSSRSTTLRTLLLFPIHSSSPTAQQLQRQRTPDHARSSGERSREGDLDTEDVRRILTGDRRAGDRPTDRPVQQMPCRVCVCSAQEEETPQRERERERDLFGARAEHAENVRRAVAISKRKVQTSGKQHFKRECDALRRESLCFRSR